MNYTKLFLFLIFMMSTQPLLAMKLASDNDTSDAVVTEFDKTGKVDGVDEKGQWIRINNKKYILSGSGSIKLEDLRSGLPVHFNIEKSKGERNGRVTRIWVEDNE